MNLLPPLYKSLSKQLALRGCTPQSAGLFMKPETILTETLTSECQQTIQQLETLKQEIKTKQENIQRQNEDFENRLNKLTHANKSIKINDQQKMALHNDCAHFYQALEKLLADIDSKIAGWDELLTSEKSPLKTEKLNELLYFSLYLKQRIKQTKTFIKKIKKDVSVAHSRFSFGFDSQQKQLNYLELMNDKK